MSKLAKVLSSLLALGLAACSTTQHRNVANVPDWNEADAAPTMTPPALAAPASTAPLLAPVSPPSASPAPVSSAPTATRPWVASAVAPTAQMPSGEKWIPLQRWCRAEGLAAPTQIGLAPSPTYALRSGNGVLTLRAGSVLARWEGLEVQLGFAPQMINGQPYVHALDLQKTIQPLLEGGRSLGLANNPVIVIDPGHGGENAGTTSVLGRHYEKEFTLDWALRLQKALTEAGWQVFLTRSNDSDLALSNRVAVAAEHKADLFLSLHFNSAAPNQSQAGLETYCLTPAGMPSNLTRGGGDETASAFPNNAFDAQNLLLALRVQRALLQVNGHNDRGIRRARFPGVLRGQQRPAVLIEGGYLSNPTEARRISDPAYRQKLAEALAGALAPERLVAGYSRLPEAPVGLPAAEARSQMPEGAYQQAKTNRQISEESSHSAEIP